MQVIQSLRLAQRVKGFFAQPLYMKKEPFGSLFANRNTPCLARPCRTEPCRNLPCRTLPEPAYADTTNNTTKKAPCGRPLQINDQNGLEPCQANPRNALS